jgi:hypothetical protein
MVALGEFRAVDKSAYANMKRDSHTHSVVATTAANTPTSACTAAAVPAATAAQSLREVVEFVDDETEEKQKLLQEVELTQIQPTATAAAATAAAATAAAATAAAAGDNASGTAAEGACGMRDMNWSRIEDILTWKKVRDYLVQHHMPLAYGNASWGFCCACVQAMITTFVIVLRQIVYGTTVWTFYAQWLVLYVCAISYIFSFSMLIAAVQIWLRQQSHVPLLKDKLFSAQHITKYTATSSTNSKPNGCTTVGASSAYESDAAVKLVEGADRTVKVVTGGADECGDNKEALVELITAMISLIEQDDVAPQVCVHLKCTILNVCCGFTLCMTTIACETTHTGTVCTTCVIALV